MITHHVDNGGDDSLFYARDYSIQIDAGKETFCGFMKLKMEEKMTIAYWVNISCISISSKISFFYKVFFKFF